jgi:deazaflavin-dependent oxidoreductase (nitroreductase family)
LLFRTGKEFWEAVEDDLQHYNMHIKFLHLQVLDVIEVSNEQEQQFLYLTTKGWKSGRQHRIEIWFVSYADRYYVISEHKQKAHWVQNIMHNPRVMFTVNSKSFEGTVRIVDEHTDSKLAEEVSSLMYTKYGWNDGLIVELTPHKEQIE